MDRRRDIQGLRAVAVLLVVVFHSGLPLPGGFVGVDVFFAISGFVITRLLLRELDATGRIDLPSFYARRARRLLPAFALMVTVVAAIGTLAMTATAQRTAGLTAAAASVFGANVFLALLETGYFAPSTEFNPFLHTWSLGVEEQFYLVFPLVLAVAWWVARGRRRGRGAVAAAVATICVVSLGAGFALAGGTVVEDADLASRLVFYASPVRAWEFGAGALVALAAPATAALSVWRVRLFGVAGLAAIAYAATRTEAGELAAVGGTCVLLAVGTAVPYGAGRILSIRPAVWLGDLSYSLYLWHWPLIVFARALWPGTGWVAPAAAVGSLAPAWLSYRYVESPIRSGEAILGRRVGVLATGCVAVSLGSSLGFLATERALAGSETMRSWANARAPHAVSVRDCDQAPLADSVSRRRCTWRAEAEAPGKVVLYGDSQAGQFTEPVVRAANRAGYDATVGTFSSCPPLGLHVRSARGVVPGCATFSADAIDWLVETRPSLVILASRTDWYLDDPAVALALGEGQLTNEAEAKARLWRQALATTLARLEAAGVPVLLVHPVPELPMGPELCAVVRIVMEVCEGSVGRELASGRLQHAIEVEAEAAAATGAASMLDLTDRLCSRTRCESARNGIIQYRDATHLSVDGALRLTDVFTRAIVAHARRNP